MICDKFETYHIPRGWDYKEVKTKCGNTKTDGSRAICPSCASNPKRMAEIRKVEAEVESDNAWSRSAGWGDW